MTDGKKYIFLNSINKINTNIPNFKMFTSKEEMLGNLIISIYDTPPSIKPPIKLEKSTYNNGMIDPEEFNDTKENYEKNIEKIKQYCKKYGQDISEIKLPTYDDMQYLCYKAVDAETMASFLMPKKTLDEEIGLGNIKYKTTQGRDTEYREYENGTKVEIYYFYNHFQKIIIDHKTKRIIKKFDITGTKVLEQEFDEKLKTNKITEYYSSNGQIRTVRMRNLYSKKLIETINYDKNGNRILNENQKLAHELIKDLTNTNFIGLKSVRNSLQDNINKLTIENIEEVLIEYKRTTGQSLLQKIEEMRCSIDSLYEFFSMKPYTTTDKLKDKIKEMYISTYSERNINDMQSFLEHTGIDNEFKAMLNDKSFQYDDFASYWKELTGRDSFESDFLNSNLAPEIKAQYNRVIWHEACSRLHIKPNLKIENSQIKNKYYSSDMVYDVQYNLHTDWMGGTITIHNKTSGISRTIDVNEFCKNMSEIDYCEFLTNIQNLPPEVLEDASVEFNKLYGHSGEEIKLKKANANGFYQVNTETTVISTVRQNTQVHELGHAIDYNYLFGINKNSSSDGNFYKIFTKEIDEYTKKGNACCMDTKNTTNPKDGLCNYCTMNEREMFAECYTLLMTGNCISKETILKYFRKTLKEAEKLLKEIRKLPDNVRLKKTIYVK